MRLPGWMAFLVCVLAGAPPAGWAQQVAPAAVANPHAAVALWANGAPGSEGKTAPEVVQTDGENERRVSSVNTPSIAPYLVRGAKQPTAAVIVMPGGGHQFLSIDHEGYAVAQYLSGHGVAAFVLKYRLARDKGSTYTVEGNALDDVQRAIRLVRAHASEWNVDPARVGVMGFSAGGELAVLAGTRWHEAGAALSPTEAEGGHAGDDIDHQSDRPSFVALMYPGGLTVPAAATNSAAAGAASPSGAAQNGVSALARQVEVKPEILAKVSQIPPAFLLCGADDRPDIAQALPQLFLAMKRAGVSAELHEYAGVGHGFGLRLSQHGAVADWPAVFVDWMDTKGFLRGGR